MAYRIILFNNRKPNYAKLPDDDLNLNSYEVVFETEKNTETKANEVYENLESTLINGYSIAMFYRSDGSSNYLNLMQTEKQDEVAFHENDFSKYIFSARNEFVSKIRAQRWNTEMRTTAEDFVIAYDQLFDNLKTKNLQL